MNTENLVEEWRDVVGYEDRYEVSNFGSVRSKSYLKRGRNVHGEFTFMTVPRQMKLVENADGYFTIDLRKDGDRATGMVHRLVAQSFISNPENFPIINHKDSNRKNNNVDNLEWCTYQHNVKHGYSSGSNSNAGDKHPSKVLNSGLVCQMRKMFEDGLSIGEIATHFGFRYDTTKSAITGKNWGHVVCNI